MKRIVKRVRRKVEIIKRRDRKRISLMPLKKMNSGNTLNKYLGIEEKVPEKVGNRNVSQPKIRYFGLVFFLRVR